MVSFVERGNTLLLVVVGFALSCIEFLDIHKVVVSYEVEANVTNTSTLPPSDLFIVKVIYVSEVNRKLNENSDLSVERVIKQRQNDRELQLDFESISPITHNSSSLLNGRSSSYRNVNVYNNSTKRIYEDFLLKTNLGEGFLQLFDELWRFKNATSNTILKNLEQLDLVEGYNWISGSVKPLRNSTDRNNNKIPNIQTQKASSNHSSKLKPKTPSSTPNSSARQKQPTSNVGFLFNNWLLQVNNKLSNVISSVTKPLTDKLSTSVVSSHHYTRVNADQNEGESLIPSDASKSIVKSKQKRQAPERRMQSSLSDNCNELDSKQVKQCRSTENLIKINLSTSFPGTLKAIEENCRHISLLLRDCWPEQLENIRLSVSMSWNESLFNLSEFSLSPLDEQNLPTCGVSPELPNFLLDRISWMWLNLCMDVKLRLDYVENLKCLSMWSQDRAQTICQDEYRRMRSYLTGSIDNSQIQRTSTQQQQQQQRQPVVKSYRFEIQKRASPSLQYYSPLITQPDSANKNSGLSTNRELESKTLCCMFDLFLRCVYKYSNRDCGRNGAQFVVNFLSRIGTDDMKYLCNGEVRMSQRNKNNGQRINPSFIERGGPFIEGNYCSDPRITSTFRVNPPSVVAIDANKFPGNDPTQKLRPLPGKGSPSSLSDDLSLFTSNPSLAQPNGSFRINQPTHLLILILYATLYMHMVPIIFR